LAGRGGTEAGDLAAAQGLTSPAGIISALWNHLSVEGFSDSRAALWPTLTPKEMTELSAFLQTLGTSR
jgi:hypothetical protein